MAFHAIILLHDDESSTPTGVQLTVALDSNNWDWTATPKGVYANDKTTAIDFYRASFDATNQAGVLVVRKPAAASFPLYITGDGSDLSSYDDTHDRHPLGDDCVEHFAFNNNLSGANGFSDADSVFNGTYGTGDLGKYGDDFVKARFTGGKHLVFDGTDDVLFLPGLTATSPTAAGTISYFLTVIAGQNAPANGDVILQTVRYGATGISVTWATDPYRIQAIVQDTGDAHSSNIQYKVTFDYGANPYPMTNDTRWHIAHTWGPRGWELWVDGVRVNKDTAFTYAPKTMSQATDFGVKATGICMGGHYDPRPEERGNFGQIKVDGLRISDEQLTKTGIDQLRNRITPFTIETVYDRMTLGGVVLNPTAAPLSAYADDCVWEMDVVMEGSTMRMVARSGASNAAPNKTYIITGTSTDGLSFTGITKAFGQGEGDYDGTPTCPSIYRTAANTYNVYFSGSGAGPTFDDPGGAHFSGFLYGTLVSGTPAYVGRVSIGTFDDTRAIGNHAIVLTSDGLYTLLLESSIAAGVNWWPAYGSGATPTAFTMDTTIYDGYNIGSPTVLDSQVTSAGPDPILLSDGSYVVALHSELDAHFRRTRNFKGLTWSFYDHLFIREQARMEALGAGWTHATALVTQAADAKIIEAYGTVFVYGELVIANSKSAILVNTFIGTPDELFAAESVSLRAERYGFLVIRAGGQYLSLANTE